ncbi:MAG: lytic transglycosylase domain-containing protein [Arenicellales bacterium]
MPQRLIICLLYLSFAFASTAIAASVYVYEDQNGMRVITDHRSDSPTLKLIKTYTPRIPVEVLGPRHYDYSQRTLSPRSTEYDTTIFKLADIYKQDRALIKAIIQIESSFNPNAVSPKGAQGLMQLMPATASSYDVNNPFDVSDNLHGGIQLFRDLMQRFDNDVRLALAAYNAGTGAVVKYKGIPPYAETQAYVKHVLQLHKHYQKYTDTYS